MKLEKDVYETLGTGKYKGRTLNKATVVYMEDISFGELSKNIPIIKGIIGKE